MLVGVGVVLVLMPEQKARCENAESKAWQITVPRLELRDASIEESIRALAAKSRVLDPAHEGVNFVWPASLDPAARLNLRLVNVPLCQAARYLARLAGMRLIPQQHAFVFALDEGGKRPAEYRFSLASATAAEVMLPGVEFKGVALQRVLEDLANAARSVDPRKMGVNVVIDAPPETRSRRITLSLGPVPFGEALHYAASLADLVVIEEPYALVITAPHSKPKLRANNHSLIAQAPASGSSGLPSPWTNRSIEPGAAGQRFVERGLAGEIKPEMSGYVAHRSMGGWPIEMDPKNKLGPESRAPDPADWPKK
jgi:hypothetical protein